MAYLIVPFCRPAATTFTEIPSGAHEKSTQQILDSVDVLQISFALIVHRFSKLPPLAT